VLDNNQGRKQDLSEGGAAPPPLTMMKTEQSKNRLSWEVLYYGSRGVYFLEIHFSPPSRLETHFFPRSYGKLIRGKPMNLRDKSIKKSMKKVAFRCTIYLFFPGGGGGGEFCNI